MRQILALFLLGTLLFLAHGVDSHKAHHKKHKRKKPSPSPEILKKSSTPKRSPPPRSPRLRPKRPPPPRRRPPPPSPRIKRPPPPRRRPPPPRSPRSPPPPSPPPPPADTSFYNYKIIEQLPHNTSSFTQGLQYEEICDQSGSNCTEVFWESTGLFGRSSVRQVQLKTGKTLRMRELPDEDFGEGLTKLNNTLYQLTWLSGKTFKYAADNFDDYTTTKTPLNDGWGATNDGTNLIIGDSTDKLYFINPSTMKTVRTITVKDGNRTVKWLNELEYINGIIYANIFTTQCIVQVDANTGNVVGWLYMNGLRQKMIDTAVTQPSDPVPDVMNGIAWDEGRKKLYVTGKLWPSMFHVKPVKMIDADDEVKEMIRSECIIDPDRPL